jgi:hypothetical protein
MTKPTPKELAQLLAGIEQANTEILSALAHRFSNRTLTNGKNADDRIKSAIRAHQAAVAILWQPAPESSISAARPSKDDGLGAVP